MAVLSICATVTQTVTDARVEDRVATAEKDQTVTVAVRVPESTRRRLTEVAKGRGEPVADTLRDLIERGLEMPEPTVKGGNAERKRVATVAAYLMQNLSDLVRDLEAKGDPEGARLLVGGVVSSCTEWQSARLNRTELLEEALKRLYAVIDSAPGKERGSLMVAALGNVRSRAAKLLGDKA
jgi:predicted DNA-binding protein